MEIFIKDISLTKFLFKENKLPSDDCKFGTAVYVRTTPEGNKKGTFIDIVINVSFLERNILIGESEITSSFLCIHEGLLSPKFLENCFYMIQNYCCAINYIKGKEILGKPVYYPIIAPQQLTINIINPLLMKLINLANSNQNHGTADIRTQMDIPPNPAGWNRS